MQHVGTGNRTPGASGRDALLSIVGIASLTFLSYVHADWSPTLVVTGIVALGMRATGLLINAAQLARNVARAAVPPPGDDP